MRLLALALCVLVARAGGTFITTGQVDVHDEDRRLLAELARRMNHAERIRSYRPVKLPPDVLTKHSEDRNKGNNRYEDKANKMSREQANRMEREQANTMDREQANKMEREQAKRISIDKSNIKSTTPQPRGGRRDLGETTLRRFPTVPVERAIRHKMIDLAEQAIYSAQYRLLELEPLANKYTGRLEYRICYIFKRLEMIEREMERIYGYLYPHAATNHPHISNARVFTFLLYYEQIAAMHIDVTYICERLAFLHGDNLAGRAKEQATAKAQGSLLNTPAGYTGPPIDEEKIRQFEYEREEQAKYSFAQAQADRPEQ